MSVSISFVGHHPSIGSSWLARPLSDVMSFMRCLLMPLSVPGLMATSRAPLLSIHCSVALSVSIPPGHSMIRSRSPSPRAASSAAVLSSHASVEDRYFALRRMMCH